MLTNPRHPAELDVGYVYRYVTAEAVGPKEVSKDPNLEKEGTEGLNAEGLKLVNRRNANKQQ